MQTCIFTPVDPYAFIHLPSVYMDYFDNSWFKAILFFNLLKLFLLNTLWT